MKAMKRKAKIGRPPSKNPRAVLVAFKVTRGEAKSLRAAARAAGLPLHVYILGRCGIER